MNPFDIDSRSFTVPVLFSDTSNSLRGTLPLSDAIYRHYAVHFRGESKLLLFLLLLIEVLMVFRFLSV